MKDEVIVNAICSISHESTATSRFESPVFEIIEDFKLESKLYRDGTTIQVLLRRQLNHKPSRFSLGPYWLDLRVGAHHVPHYCVPEATVREAACRFLLKHSEGVAPLLN